MRARGENEMQARFHQEFPPLQGKAGMKENIYHTSAAGALITFSLTIIFCSLPNNVCSICSLPPGFFLQNLVLLHLCSHMLKHLCQVPLRCLFAQIMEFVPFNKSNLHHEIVTLPERVVTCCLQRA